MPGGGPAEPSDEEVLADPEARWNVSGKAEVNCLACHNRSGRQDHSEWAKQVLRENLRWAATAAGGVGEVGGMASRLKETWDVYDGPNLDDHEWAVVPSVKYRTVDFDSKHRYFFDLNYQPADDRCLACHSVSPKDAAMWSADADVHTAAGLEVHGLPQERPRPPHASAATRARRPRRATGRRNPSPAGAAISARTRTARRSVLPGRLGRPLPQAHGHPARPLQEARLHGLPFGAEAEGRLHPRPDVAGEPARHLRRRDLVDGHARDHRARL